MLVYPFHRLDLIMFVSLIKINNIMDNSYLVHESNQIVRKSDVYSDEYIASMLGNTNKEYTNTLEMLLGLGR